MSSKTSKASAAKLKAPYSATHHEDRSEKQGTDFHYNNSVLLATPSSDEGSFLGVTWSVLTLPDDDDELHEQLEASVVSTSRAVRVSAHVADDKIGALRAFTLEFNQVVPAVLVAGPKEWNVVCVSENGVLASFDIGGDEFDATSSKAEQSLKGKKVKKLLGVANHALIALVLNDPQTGNDSIELRDASSLLVVSSKTIKSEARIVDAVWVTISNRLLLLTVSAAACNVLSLEISSASRTFVSESERSTALLPFVKDLSAWEELSAFDTLGSAVTVSSGDSAYLWRLSNDMLQSVEASFVATFSSSARKPLPMSDCILRLAPSGTLQAYDYAFGEKCIWEHAAFGMLLGSALYPSVTRRRIAFVANNSSVRFVSSSGLSKCSTTTLARALRSSSTSNFLDAAWGIGDKTLKLQKDTPPTDLSSMTLEQQVTYLKEMASKQQSAVLRLCESRSDLKPAARVEVALQALMREPEKVALESVRVALVGKVPVFELDMATCVSEVCTPSQSLCLTAALLRLAHTRPEIFHRIVGLAGRIIDLCSARWIGSVIEVSALSVLKEWSALAQGQVEACEAFEVAKVAVDAIFTTKRREINSARATTYFGQGASKRLKGNEEYFIETIEI